MKIPTTEQQTVVDNHGRVRVVRASPGSGKTTLVGMIIRREIETWPAAGRGIAALSFTRVGGQEIRKELGYDLGHPHFVGTIDAFLFRYIVRPYLRQVYPTWAPPRLIPADWLPKHWSRAPGNNSWIYRGNGGAQAKNYNLFEVSFIGEDTKGPVIAYPRPFQSGINPVVTSDQVGLLSAKRQSWCRLGWITHADAALLAYELLNDATHGAAIHTALLRRFPLLIVDELQDTGFFLAKSVLLLLEQPTSRAVLVGDPNQAIYEFNGARPALFADFEAITGAVRFPLGHSQRCMASVVGAAVHFKESADPFNPSAGNCSRAFLIRYADMVVDLPRVVAVIRSRRPLADMKVIARQSKTVAELTSRSVNDVPSLHCPVLTHAYRAVRALREGYNVNGLANARAAIDLAVFRHEGVSDECLVLAGVDSRQWKALAVRCLMRWNDLAITQNLHEWQMAAGCVIDEGMAAFNLPPSLPYQTGQLKPQKRSGWNKPASEFLPIGTAAGATLSGVPVQTVHAVKGETHDVTVFVSPNPSQALRCPSVVWWSNDPAHLEERRIAYVAMTRTRGDLVLCVSESCYQRLAQQRIAFVTSLKCMTVDEFLPAF
jgi:DNA helicase II / ATP-dependent DNA helicase PcrA